MLKTIKPEIRIIGWDDSPFTFRDKNTLLIGVVCRGGTQIDGVITTRIKVDGNDSTRKIIQAIRKNPHYKQLRLIMLEGITFGGFNIVDINKIYKSTKLPVLVVIRTNPNLKNIRKSLMKFKDHEKRWRIIERAGKIREFRVRSYPRGRNTVYCQYMGIEAPEVEKILNLTSIHSLTPEPIRIAHLIGYGLKGRKIK